VLAAVGKVVSVINQKGGVGKSTTSINLGDALAEAGERVLLVDLDPQASLSQSLGIEVHQLERSMYDVMLGESLIKTIIQKPPIKDSRVDVAPAQIAMSRLERQLSGKLRFESVLKDALAGVKDSYSFILIDCRPSLDLLEINAMCASEYLIIPLLAQKVPLYGTDQLLEMYEEVKERMNPSLEILGVLLAQVDNRNKLTGLVRDEVRGFFKEKVLDTEIRVNVKIAEAAGLSPSVLFYDTHSKGAADYRNLAQEVLQRA
jgi:chromosome partitioning protein